MWSFRLKLVPSRPNIDFLRWRHLGFVVASLMTLASMALVASLGLNLGIDLKGGLLIEARSSGTPDISAMRAAIGELGLGEVGVQRLGLESDVLIRLPQQPGNDAAQQALAQRVKESLETAVGAIEYRRIEYVGPQVSKELLVDGVIALGLALAAMLGYVWVRFEWQFGIGTVLALVFDAVTTLGLFALLNLEFNLPIIAAILTTIGYSMNDKVVIFDRVRENLRKYRAMELMALLNHSINDTLARTVNTSFTTLLAVLALLFFGGDVLREFNLAMTWGVFVGTASSVFIAAPAVLYLNLNRGAVAPAHDSAVRAGTA